MHSKRTWLNTAARSGNNAAGQVGWGLTSGQRESWIIPRRTFPPTSPSPGRADGERAEPRKTERRAEAVSGPVWFWGQVLDMEGTVWGTREERG